MRPRKFILPQAGTGGYRIRPYVFCGGGAPRGVFSIWSKTKSVGAHSICARGSLPCRKRARADMESAPTFFVAGGVPSQRRCPAWSCLPLLKARSVGAHSICARGGLSCRKQARADMESAPTFFCGGRSPLAEAVPRVELSLFVESKIRRGAFYMRPRRFILPQAGTGGYGIRPYVFLQRRPRGAFLPAVRASGFISACALSKTILCGILFFYNSTGKPGANRRRKAIGAHRVSQLPTRNCCFTAAGSFASFWGQELTRVKTHQYTGGTKQGIYNALLFFAARGYCLIRSDSAFRHGSAMS